MRSQSGKRTGKQSSAFEGISSAAFRHFGKEPIPGFNHLGNEERASPEYAASQIRVSAKGKQWSVCAR